MTRIPGKCAECGYDIPPGTLCHYSDKEFCTGTCRTKWLERQRRCKYCDAPLSHYNPAAYCDEICFRAHKISKELELVKDQQLAFNLAPPPTARWGRSPRRR
jgi:hypothetical protein